jgi:hypothetical protein
MDLFRKFVWDGMRVTIPENNNKVMAMSFYPKESYGFTESFPQKLLHIPLKPIQNLRFLIHIL